MHVASIAGVRPIGAKGVFAAVLGNGFEFFDFTVYATFLDLIGRPSIRRATPSSAISRRRRPSASAYRPPDRRRGSRRPGDRAGRRPAMTLSIALMAIGSGMIALTPGFAAIEGVRAILLIAARLMQGFSVGGEVGPATMFILEARLPTTHAVCELAARSQNLGSLASGGIGVLLALALSKASYMEWGWRVPFATGVLIAPGRRLYPQPTARDAGQVGSTTREAARVLSTVLRSDEPAPPWPWLISGRRSPMFPLGSHDSLAIRPLHLPRRRRCSAQ